MYTLYSPQWKVVTKKLTIRLSQIFTSKTPNNSTPLMSPSFFLWKLSESSKTSCVHWWLPGQVTQCVKPPYSSKNPQSRAANHIQSFPFNHGKSRQSCWGTIYNFQINLLVLIHFLTLLHFLWVIVNKWSLIGAICNYVISLSEAK